MFMAHYLLLAFYSYLSWADFCSSRKDREIPVYRQKNSTSQFLLVQTRTLIDMAPDYIGVTAHKQGNTCVISDHSVENTFISEYGVPSLQPSFSTAAYIESAQFIPAIPNGAILRFAPFLPSNYLIVYLGVRDGKERLEFGLLSLTNYSTTALDIQVPYEWNGEEYFQQEARLVQLDDDRIFAIFTARFTRQHGLFTQIYVVLTFNPSTDSFDVGSPKWIDYGRNVHSKIFVPLLFANSVYLIPSINPLVVLRLHPDDVGSDNNIGITTVVYEGNQSHLPWKEEYGTHIRGGTAAAVAGDFYLSFFHSTVTGRAQGMGVDLGYHVFMGAMTLCPRPPFLIRSMSQFPIVVNLSWYEGPWLNKETSYIVYPTGIDIDDQRHMVTVSIGHQDRDTFVVRMGLPALLKTLICVNDCLCP